MTDSSAIKGSDIRVGDVIEFGQYPQRMNGETEPIEWRVLAVEDGRALIITEKLLKYVTYNEEQVGVTWETCTLRKWMNGEFLKKAFCRAERDRIATVRNVNYDNEKYGTAGGKDTEDRIFALSIDEVKKYFRSDSNRVAGVTEYAYINGEQERINKEYNEKYNWNIHTNFEFYSKGDVWWLRTPGLDSDCAAIVDSDGGVFTNGSYVDDSPVAVRPALWLNL